MKNIFRGKSPEDCQEHMELSARIDELECEIRQMKCDDHLWELTNNPFWYMVEQIQCTKCGKLELVAKDRWREIELSQAKAEYDRLSGPKSTTEEKSKSTKGE